MKATTKIAIGLAAGIAVGLIIYSFRNSKARRALNQVAEEGYETAHDVLFPKQGVSSKKLHFGPILPSSSL